MTQFNFVPLSEEHFELLHDWFIRPHVSAWWQNALISIDAVIAKYTQKISDDAVFPYLIYLDETPIGYIQSYCAPAVGGGWWPDAKPGTWGLDVFIGEERYLGRGLGIELVRQFSDELLARPDVERVIADPSPENARAIRVYERAGFRRDSEITTPDGPAILMISEQCSTS